MSSKSKQSRVEKYNKIREEGFNLGSVPHAKLKSYSALHDPNMRHYFENSNVQRHLYNTGQIDSHGRVINLHKNKTKLHILDREFKEAELSEARKLREEEEMRVSFHCFLCALLCCYCIVYCLCYFDSNLTIISCVFVVVASCTT